MFLRKSFNLFHWTAFKFLLITLSIFLLLLINFQNLKDSLSSLLLEYTPITESDIALGDKNLAQDDPRLLDFIKSKFLIPPPSKLNVNTKVDTTPFDPKLRKNEQQEIYRFVLNLLKNQTNGFFIECGANDGEFYSNTLPLELNQNWTGLLVEPDPRPFKRLKERNRNAWIINSCLATTPISKKIKMQRNDKAEGLSYIAGYRDVIGNAKDYYEFEAQCFPLYSILKAVGVTTIDYFSLDIEGAELQVLKNIPWDSVIIKALSIEVHPKYEQPIKDYMISIGFKFIKFIKNGYSHDQIYLHPTVK